MKYYLIAGEASGDLHGSNLVKALKVRDPEADIRAWGGDLMEAQGAFIVKHYRELAFMGFKEVAANLRTILRNIKLCKADIATFAPDVIIFIDYPGFNLRIATWAKKQNYKTIYYIAPQVWAWKESRVKRMRRDIDKLLVILPFEQAYFKKHGIDAVYVGHPLSDVIPQFKPDPDFFDDHDLPSDKPIIALLPGSRKQEVTKTLEVMLSVMPRFKNHLFVIAGAPGLSAETYAPFLKQQNADIVYNRTYELLSRAEAAVVSSGTATLETAFFGVPEVVVYKGSKITYYIAKALIKVQYISLVNLIADRLLVRELIQGELNTETISAELDRLLNDGNYRAKMKAAFAELRAPADESGASGRAADEIMKFLGRTI